MYPTFLGFQQESLPCPPRGCLIIICQINYQDTSFFVGKRTRLFSGCWVKPELRSGLQTATDSCWVVSEVAQISKCPCAEEKAVIVPACPLQGRRMSAALLPMLSVPVQHGWGVGLPTPEGKLERHSGERSCILKLSQN